MDNNNYLKIQIYDSMLVMEWVGHIDTIDYRHGHHVLLKTVLETRSIFWLLDYKQSGDITFTNSEWTIKEWLPKAIEVMNEVEKIAIVVPTNIFNKISLRIMTTMIISKNKEAEIAFFNNPEEAKLWLVPELYTVVY